MGGTSFVSLRARLARLGPVRGTFSLAAAGVLGLACVLVVSACGSSSAAPAATTTSTLPTTTSGSATTPTGTAAAASAFAAYRSCLQSHGDTSTFGGGGGFFGRGGGGAGFGGTGTTSTSTTPAATTPRVRPALSAADQKAIAACASLRPTGGFSRGGAGGGFPGGGGFTSTNPAFQKFEACLKSHGVQTSTTPGAAGGFGRGGSSANRTAFAACRSDLPAGSFGGGAGGFGSTGGSAGGPSSSTFAAYQACLKSHGVQPGAANQSAAKIASAQTACASILQHAASSTTPATTTSG